MIGGENNLKLMRTQEMGNFNNYCNVACLKLKLKVKFVKRTGYLRIMYFLKEAKQLRSDAGVVHFTIYSGDIFQV